MANWWDSVRDWWIGDEDEPKPDSNAVADLAKVQQEHLLNEWRQAISPSISPVQQRSDPFESALAQWQGTRAVQGPQPRPMQGPEPKPETAPTVDPWSAAVNAWRDGPPVYNPLSSANAGSIKPQAPSLNPFTYDVAPPQQSQVGYSFDRPDTGVTGLQQTAYGGDTLSSALAQPSQWKPLLVDDLGIQSGYNAPQRPGGFLQNVMDVGPVDATIAAVFGNTPGYDYLVDTYNQQKEEGTNRGWDAFKDDFWTSLTALNVPGKAIESTAIPGTAAIADFLTNNDTGQQAKGNVSLGQLASAFGEAVNKTLNPFNPNQVDMSYWQLWQDKGKTMWDIFSNNLNSSRLVRETIESLPEDQRTAANVALVNIISGPNAVEAAANSILNQAQNVQVLYSKADDAQKAGDFAAAAEYGRQADELKRKNKTDLVDEPANVWAELMGGIFLDPTNWLPAGWTKEAAEATRAARLAAMGEDEAVGVLSKAVGGSANNPLTWAEWLSHPLESGSTLYKEMIGDAPAWLSYINPANLLKRTPETNARLSTDVLFRVASQLTSGVGDRAAARALLDTWATTPQDLVRGVVIPGLEKIADTDGIVKFGPGFLANPELIEHYPVLASARDSIAQMASLAGDAPLNPIEFLSEFNDVVFKVARSANGLDALAELPGGAASFRLARTELGLSIVEYLDKAGKVVSKSNEMLPYDAQLFVKKLDNTTKAAGETNPIMRAWGTQKAILSDMYLGMSPGYWIKNALSATATLLTDNTYTLLPTRGILNDLGIKFGVAPTSRSLDAAMSAAGSAAIEAMGGASHWSERVLGANNLYARLMNRLYSVPFGATDIAGSVPFGEQNFALRATYVPFKRYLSENWKWATSGFGDALRGMGIDDNLVRSLTGIVYEAGVNGNKQQVAESMRQVVARSTVPYTLNELGIPDELISAEGWKKLNDVFTSALPGQIDDAIAEIKSVFGEEIRRAGEILNSAPPQPSRGMWTDFESVQDGADVIDSMVDAAKRAGMDAGQATQRAEQLMQQTMQAERHLWSTFRGEVAQSTDPNALNVAMDLLARWYDWRKMARAQVDDLGKAAAQVNTPEAWAKKWEGTGRIYGEFTDWFGSVVDEARQDLLKISSGTPVEQRYNWMDVIQRYVDYDEPYIRRTRTMGLGSVQDAGSAYDEVIQANRQYVDKSFVELFSSFRRYPTQDSLDLIADGVRKVETMGAQAAAFLASKRAELLPGQASVYHQLRNKVWSEFFDNSVVMNKITQRQVVFNGLAQQSTNGLRWVDEFAGGEFRLVGKDDKGFWQAVNTATGATERFVDPVDLSKMKKEKVVTSSLPSVPPNIIQEFYRLTGSSTEAVDDLIKQIDADAAARYARQEAEMMALLDQPVRVPTMHLAGESVETAAKREADKIVQEIDAAKEALSTLRTEWDKVARAGRGYLKLENAVGSYVKNGVANVPENKFEDLYGLTVAGRQIDNQDDVNALLQEYYELRQLVRGGRSPVDQAIEYAFDPLDLMDDAISGVDDVASVSPATLSDVVESGVYNKMSAREIVQHVADNELLPDISQVKGMGRTKLLDFLRNYVAPMTKDRHKLASTIEGLNWFGLVNAESDLFEVIQGMNNNLYSLAGNKAPEMGDVALHQIRTLQDAYGRVIAKLPEILEGKPNRMTPAQQVRVLDELNRILPQYDDILAGAVQVGEKMGNFAMLNYGDKRNLDLLLGAVFPYHYFWSRSAKNWLRRVASKPGVVNFWYESERAIDLENEQNDLPQHLRGTLPNPLPFGPDRIGNPLTYALPFAMYMMGNEFVNPDDAKSEAERWIMNVQKFTPGLYPLADYALKATLDQQAPLPGGRRRTDAIQLGDFLPLYRLGGYARQAATGEMGPQGPLAYGDEYDLGRAGKQVGLSAMRGDTDPDAAMWGTDVGYQLQTGSSALPEQDPGAVDAWQQGAQQAGAERLTSRAMSFLLGVPGYYLSEEEKRVRQMKGERVGLGYGSSNPYGSRAAVDEYTGMGGDRFESTFNYSQLYPAGDNRKRARPGERAAQSQYYDEFGGIMDNMNMSVTKFLLENPEATSKELNDLKSPYWDEVEELKSRYPSLPEIDRNRGLNTRYMNPAEQAQQWVEKTVGYKPPGKPIYPGVDASVEDKKAYYLAKAEWDYKRLDHIDRTFSQFLAYNDEYPDAWKEQARGMVEKMYASELLRGYDNRFAGAVEKAWDDRQSFVEEVEDAEWQYKEKAVVDRLGKRAYRLIQEYYALPKDSDERRQFKDAHPLLDRAFMASYHPEEYDKFVDLFGASAFDMVAQKPAHPGDGATEDQLQSYYEQMNAYTKANPNAEAARLWLNGRRFGAAEGSDSYGKAYDEAVSIFGPNIFDILNSFPSGGTKEQRAAWYRSHPKENMLRSGYMEWKKEFQDKDKASVENDRTGTKDGSVSNADAGEGYTGPRPVGSNRQPIGSFDPLIPSQPSKWASYNWDTLLDQQAVNPWTQRANELNAGILGGASVPGEMSAATDRATYNPLSSADYRYQRSGSKPASSGVAGEPSMDVAQKYAMMDENYVKGEMSRQEWAARRGSLVERFGSDAGSIWDAYYNLPKGEKRKEYIADHPEMRVYNLAAYNPDDFATASDLFGQDAIMAWARSPRYEDTPVAKAARSRYWDDNPKAFLFHSWLNGRPANNSEGDQGGDFKYNLGADYSAAKDLFGDNIWNIVESYKRGWDKVAKRSFFEKYPQLSKFFDWWYGDTESASTTGGGRASGGGGGGRGYSPSRSGSRTVVNIQPVYAQPMARGLAEPPRITGYQSAGINDRWLEAGRNLSPGKPKEWSPTWIRGLRV